MNREELEKEIKQIADYLWCNDDELVSEIMKLIPEVLKSVIPELQNTQTNDDEINSMRYWNNDCIYYMKKNAKHLYNINL